MDLFGDNSVVISVDLGMSRGIGVMIFELGSREPPLTRISGSLARLSGKPVVARYGIVQNARMKTSNAMNIVAAISATKGLAPGAFVELGIGGGGGIDAAAEPDGSCSLVAAAAKGSVAAISFALDDFLFRIS